MSPPPYKIPLSPKNIVAGYMPVMMAMIFEILRVAVKITIYSYEVFYQLSRLS